MGNPAVELKAGSTLGRYELVREIGRGGFAAVWLARLPGPGGFEQRVAIKMIRTDIGTDPSFRNMFLDEARLAAHINHPNVASIFELGQEGDVLYMVMEHVVGRPLHILRNLATRSERKIPVEIVIRILADTCAGLHAAHEVKRDGKSLEVIHRDVSPQNILVSDKGVSKLIDFGVAKANDRLAGDTSTGLAKGKVRYMAPEQALMRPVDRRVDIWSVGAVAFDLIEGRPPFDGPNDLARIYGLLSDEPAPPFTVHVPPPIERVIRKSLSRKPSDRWPTAAALRTAFEEALDECRMRVSPDTVVEWFGDALVPDGDESNGPSETSVLRERLRRPASNVSMATMDIAIPQLGDPGMPERVETLAAVSSVGIVPPVRPRRLLVPTVAALATVLGAAAAWSLFQPAPLPPPRPPPIIAAPAPTPTIPPPVPLDVDDDPATAVAALPAATTAATAAPVVVAPTPQPTTTTTTTPTTPTRVTPAARPKPTPKPKPPATATPTPKPHVTTSPSARPRYDDTIQ